MRAIDVDSIIDFLKENFIHLKKTEQHADLYRRETCVRRTNADDCRNKEFHFACADNRRSRMDKRERKTPETENRRSRFA